jgi:hypothetical protein
LKIKASWKKLLKNKALEIIIRNQSLGNNHWIFVIRKKHWNLAIGKQSQLQRVIKN